MGASSMSRLHEMDMRKMLPSSIAHDSNIQALAEILTMQLLDLIPSINLVTLLPNLSRLSDDVVDELAWHFHVDFHDQTASRRERENLIYQSIAWHRKKGTIGLVEESIAAIYDESKVVENWEYDSGEPYKFKLQLTGAIMSPKTKSQVFEMLDCVKNVRSWCDGLEYIRSLVGEIVSVGGLVTVAGNVDILPNLGVGIELLPQHIFSGGVVSVYQSINV